jgi:hypothetical protein
MPHNLFSLETPDVIEGVLMRKLEIADSEVMRIAIQQEIVRSDESLQTALPHWRRAVRQEAPNNGTTDQARGGPVADGTFRVLARLRGLERALLGQYESDVRALLAGLANENYDNAVAFAALPAKIRGFGHVKQANVDVAATERERLLQDFVNPALQIRRSPLTFPSC